MNAGLYLLTVNAVVIGILHTVVGPDHYVPFVAMARARGWSVARTAAITAACGVGHVVSSAALAVVGIALGLGVEQAAHIESWRGSIATWGLIAFGAVYLVWGLRRAFRHHEHDHDHASAPGHRHDRGGSGRTSLTPWVLFTIFVFGPCEPMIPLIMFPAAGHDWWGVTLTSVGFGLATIATMLALVALGLKGVRLLPLHRMERYSHALAGATILLTGGAMQVFGL